jgi:hypothetical protein
MSLNEKSEEQNRLLKEQNAKLEKRLRLQEESFNISNAAIDSLKEALGIQQRRSTEDSQLLKTSKEINNSILNQKTGLRDVSKISTQIAKNDNTIQKGRIQEISLNKKVGDTLKENQGALEVISAIYNEERSSIEEMLRKQAEGVEIDKEKLGELQKINRATGAQLDRVMESITPEEKKLVSLRQQLEELEKQNNKRKEELILQKKLDKSLGITGKLTKSLGKIPGIGDAANDAFENVQSKLRDSADETGKVPSRLKTAGMFSKELGKNLLNAVTDPAMIVGLIVKSFLKINEASVEYQRTTGRTVTTFNQLNNSQILFSDYIKTATALTKELGAEAELIFTPETMQEASEMVKLMGMSTSEVAKLARFSKVTGGDLKKNNLNLSKSLENFRKINKTGVSNSFVFSEIAKTSDYIALSIGGTTEELGLAVAQAKKFGLTLEQTSKIADTLLDFESSIESELQAELLTGQRINLDRARSLALADDLAGLSEEIGSNEAIISGFLNGNRVQRESMAKTLGMSKDDLAKMIYDQRAINGLSEEQLEKITGISSEDQKRLTIQQSITDSMMKLGEAMAGPLESFVQILESLSSMSTMIIGIVALISILKTAQMAYNVQQGIATAMAARHAAIEAEGAAASVYGSAYKSLGGIPIVGMALAAGAAALAIAAMMGAFSSSKSKVGHDIFSPGQGTSGHGKRTLFGPEGAIQLNNKDTVIAGTNLFGDDVIAEPNKPTEMGEKGSLKIASPSTVDMSSTNSRLDAILAAIERGSVIMFEGDKLGETVNLGSRSI